MTDAFNPQWGTFKNIETYNEGDTVYVCTAKMSATLSDAVWQIKRFETNANGGVSGRYARGGRFECVVTDLATVKTYFA